ncbi:MAG: hypothetical protein ACI9UV_001843, partial [Algoriphagus sp.]
SQPNILYLFSDNATNPIPQRRTAKSGNSAIGYFRNRAEGYFEQKGKITLNSQKIHYFTLQNVYSDDTISFTPS